MRSIFISHIADEAPVADAFKTYLARCFGGEISIFVSSDYESIVTGEEWYRAVVSGIKAASVVVVLLSRDSVDRRWINFESGLALGAGIKFLPLTIRNFSATDVGLPLSQLHLRSLVDALALEGAVRAIAEALGRDQGPLAGIPEFIRQLTQIEDTLPVKSIQIEPFIQRHPGQVDPQLRFRLSNTGNRDVELIEVEACVPRSVIVPSWDPQPLCIANVMDAEWRVIDGAEHVVMWEKPYGGMLDNRFRNRSPLPTIISPHWTPRLCDFLRIPIQAQHESSQRFRVQYKVAARGLYCEPSNRKLRDIAVLE